MNFTFSIGMKPSQHLQTNNCARGCLVVLLSYTNTPILSLLALSASYVEAVGVVMTSPDHEVVRLVPIHVLMGPHASHALHDLALEVHVVVRECKHSDLVNSSKACVGMCNQLEET